MAAPALLLLVWAATAHPAGLGFLGILVGLFAVSIAVLAVVLSSREAPSLPRRRQVLLLLFFSGLVATAFYWYRVWSYRQYEMEGIPLVLFYFMAFWWPGLFVAATGHFLERGLAPARRRELLWHLGVGVLAGALGTAAYATAEELYYRDRDRQPLEEAVALLGPGGRGAEPGSFSWEHGDGLLEVRFRVDPAAAEATYHLLRMLEERCVLARTLLARKDTDRVKVLVGSPGGDLLRFEASEADGALPLWSLVWLDRSLLPEEGRLRQEDLAAMAWVHPGDFLDRDRYDAFLARFRYGIGPSVPSTEEEGEAEGRAGEAGRERAVEVGVERAVEIAFDAAGVPGPSDVDMHALAWSTANRVVTETARLFPDVTAFRAALPGLEATVLRREVLEGGPHAAAAPYAAAAPHAAAAPYAAAALVPAHPGAPIGPESLFRLQHFLLPPESVLGLVVRREGKGEADPDPARFYPGRLSLSQAQVAVWRAMDPLVEHVAGVLHEEILAGTGRLHVTAVGPEGRATLWFAPWQGEVAGPLALEAGETGWLGEEEVRNLGWLPRADFRGSRDEAPGGDSGVQGS